MGTWRMLSVLTRDMEDMVISDVTDDIILPIGRYPVILVLISLLELYQELRVKKVGTWKMLRVPDWRFG